LDALDKQSTIYASQPWSDTSEAIAAYEPETHDIPAEAEELDLKYFLEVFIARNFVEDWAANFPTPPTAQQRCARLIEYAITYTGNLGQKQCPARPTAAQTAARCR
jgi:hypothetical protein